MCLQSMIRMFAKGDKKIMKHQLPKNLIFHEDDSIKWLMDETETIAKYYGIIIPDDYIPDYLWKEDSS